MIDDLILVRILRTFSKHGVGHDLRAREGERIYVSPEMADYLEDNNLAEVLFEEDENEDNTWRQ